MFYNKTYEDLYEDAKERQRRATGWHAAAESAVWFEHIHTHDVVNINDANYIKGMFRPMKYNAWTAPTVRGFQYILRDDEEGPIMNNAYTDLEEVVVSNKWQRWDWYGGQSFMVNTHIGRNAWTYGQVMQGNIPLSTALRSASFAEDYRNNFALLNNIYNANHDYRRLSYIFVGGMAVPVVIVTGGFAIGYGGMTAIEQGTLTGARWLAPRFTGWNKAAMWADATYQLATKDVRDFNLFEVASFGTFGGNMVSSSLWGAGMGTVGNLSWNSVVGVKKGPTRHILSNPLTGTNTGMIFFNTAGGLTGGAMFIGARGLASAFGTSFFGNWMGDNLNSTFNQENQ